MYDLAIIGGGTAGISAAKEALGAGLKTILFEKDRDGFGGTCLNRGCIPTKFLLNHIKSGASWEELQERKNELVKQIRTPLLSYLESKGLDIIWGQASFVDKMALWFYDIPWHGLKPNWPSAIAQGAITSIMVRAYLLTRDYRYLDLAYKSYEALKTDIKRGGVLNYYEDDNGIVLEEFPQSQKNELSHILNGFIYLRH